MINKKTGSKVNQCRGIFNLFNLLINYKLMLTLISTGSKY